MKLTHHLIALALCLVIPTGSLMAKRYKLTSPDGHNVVCVDIKGGRAYYSVWRDGKTVLAPSRLGLIAQGGYDLSENFRVAGVETASVDSVWHQVWGENKDIRENYRELSLHLRARRADLTLRFRAFADGIGFRYEVAAQGTDSLFITRELTEFCLSEDARAWSIPADANTYELLYRDLPVSKTQTANTPITMRTPSGVYLSIHEAALYDYPEMTLERTDSLRLEARLAPWPDGLLAREPARFNTPWRTVQLADRAVGLINSSLILNLNPACALEDTSWIRPKKYVGVWWGMHVGIWSWVMGDRHGATTERAMEYIDFAARNGIDAILAEGWNKGWEGWGGNQEFSFTEAQADFDLQKVCQYGKEKGVMFIGHHETGGNIPSYERQMDAGMKLLQDMGSHDLKTGYAGGFKGGFSHHGQYGVRHYQRVVEVAAKHRLTIDAHEPIKDTGIRRTWPNMMTREGARGMEWNGWSAGNPPSHHVMLPFTRLLSGPMDYTPGTFDLLLESSKHSPDFKRWNDQDKGNARANTTLCKQLANWVILYSPLQMASDMIENYEAHPCFQFFRDFDPDCEHSEALDGEPGEFIVVVREAKGRFFLGASTNEESRNLTVKLDFLKPGQTYRAIIYADAPDADWQTNPQAYKITEQQVQATDSLNIHLAPGGGQAITFVPVVRM
ncbi:MAG: glycoside hydrolase family 97 protein [Alloprevotella sp.]|nr:glycoside hydrolase family 97 protein [Alloprevotella sp.]